MLRFWNWLLLGISTLLLITSLKVLLDYWQYDERAVDIAQLMLHQVSPADLRRQIETAIAENRPEDARMYLRLAATFGYALDASAYEPSLQRLESPLNSALRTASEFSSGFLSGDAHSNAAVAGAVVADFTVVGDARDLWEQYQLYSSGKPVNPLIVTLAGVGVGLTAATVMSAGTATPVKSGVSTSKLAARSGRLSPKFQQFLLRQGSEVFDYHAFLLAARSEKSLDGMRAAAVRAYNPAAARAIQQTAEQVNNIRKASSTADVVHLLQYVDDAQELARLEKLTLKYGTQTKGVLKLLGKSALGTVRVLRKSTELLLSMLSALLAFIAFLFSFSGIISKKLSH